MGNRFLKPSFYFFVVLFFGRFCLFFGLRLLFLGFLFVVGSLFA